MEATAGSGMPPLLRYRNLADKYWNDRFILLYNPGELCAFSELRAKMGKRRYHATYDKMRRGVDWHTLRCPADPGLRYMK